MEILQITGDKPEFSNFIGDTLILKEKSKVCLNKASFSIPVMVNRNVYVPQSVAAGYTDIFFNVLVNGIDIGITYQDFYDAYISLAIMEDPTRDEFFSGTFQLYVDNLCTFVDDANNEYDIPNFSAITAEACSTKFDYYQFDVQNKTEITNIGNYQQDLVPPLVVNGNNIVSLKDNRRLTNFGITCLYAPRKMTAATSSNVTWTAADLFNFNTNGTPNKILTADANPAMAVCPNTFDPNGGWITGTPRVNAGKLCMGLIFMSKGHDDPLNITGVYQPENFDVGVEFYIDVGVRTFRIIDGKEKFVYWDATANAEVETIKLKYNPPNKIFTFDHLVDKFWFIVRKGRQINGTQEFTTTIIQGPGPNPEDVNNRVIFVASTTMKTSQIQIQTLAYAEGAFNGFDNWEYIPVSSDSQIEDDYLDLGALQDNKSGIRTAQTFGIVPQIENAAWEDERTFWEAIGIIQTEQENNSLLTTEGNGYNKTLSWPIPVNGPRTYYFGTNQIIDTIDKGINTYVKSSTDPNIILNFIPREISFSLMDMTINPRSGSFVRTGITGTNGFFDSGTFNKVVNYIQTDKEDLELNENQLINYNYEAFNLVYRKLDNRQDIPITQLKAKLSFKDFEQNNEVQIKSIYGVGKFELLFDKD